MLMEGGGRGGGLGERSSGRMIGYGKGSDEFSADWSTL